MLMVVSVLILYHDDDARTYIQACSNSVISFQHSLAFLARQVDKALTGAVSLFSNSTTQRGQTASALCCQDPSQSLLCPLFRWHSILGLTIVARIICSLNYDGATRFQTTHYCVKSISSGFSQARKRQSLSHRITSAKQVSSQSKSINYTMHACLHACLLRIPGPLSHSILL
jgi:hypothetical protein